MGEDSSLSMIDVIDQYSRFFFGAKDAASWSDILVGLEESWLSTPDSLNTAIPVSLFDVRCTPLWAQTYSPNTTQ